jgi:2-polyprenyl-6-methoxyphenol hydroxylase-like FAD-dependent oxidoreductase
MSREPMNVIIIGAGTGGLCLAHGLKRHGINVAVYERDRTRADGLQGYRVGINAHGVASLKACLPPELFATFLATCARTPGHFNILTEQMTELLCVPLNDEEMSGGKSVSRMTLRQVLLTGLEEQVHFDKTFTSYEQHADGSVTAHFADGTHATGDLLIGADGARSKVRRQLLPHAQVESTGIVSIAAKVPMSEASRALLPPKVLDGITLVNAPKGFGAILHVMEFPWSANGPKEGIGSNDAELLARWPGLLFDNTRDYLMWGVWGALRNLPANPKALSQPALLALATEITDGWHPNLRALIRASDPATTFSLDIRTSVPIDAWQTTNVTVLGDAVHLMTPGRGVGANTALRDAALLASRLGDAQDGKMSGYNAVAGYEAEMRRYGFHAVAESRKQFDERDALHRPVVGRMALGAMRTGLRVVNNVPLLKRRMIAAENEFRGAEPWRKVSDPGRGCRTKAAAAGRAEKTRAPVSVVNDLDTSCLHGGFQNVPISLILIRIRECELLDGFVKSRRLAEIAGEQCGVARFRHRVGQRMSAGDRVFAEIFDVESGEIERALHVAQLPHVEVVAGMAHFRPAEKNIARRLQ